MLYLITHLLYNIFYPQILDTRKEKPTKTQKPAEEGSIMYAVNNNNSQITMWIISLILTGGIS